MASKNMPPLDEIVWSNPMSVARNQGIHSNSVLFYFAESPFFDPMSNNGVLFRQAQYNASMLPILATRDVFEGRLRSMHGLEYVVAQEPAETGPGMGTGVWVIRKQVRQKGKMGADDEVEVLADYFVVGENIYQAPTFGDVMNSRIATMSSAISNIFPAASGIQKWSPALGHVYQTPSATKAAPRTRGESKEPTPMPDGLGKPAAATSGPQKSETAPDSRLAEESLAIHLRYGGDYMDENPITGQPGQFHLSSTGRSDKLAVPQAGKAPVGTVANGKTPMDPTNPLKDGKLDKKSAAPPKPKRRKSRGGGTTTPS